MKVLIPLLFILVSCGPRGSLYFDPGPYNVTYDLMQAASYKDVKEKVLDKYCITCHGSAGNVNLETYENVMANFEGIKRTVLFSKTMPRRPYKSLSKEEFDLVASWVLAGGPTLPLNGKDPGALRMPILAANYLSIKENIIDKRCIICHQEGGSGAKYLMTSREVMLANRMIIPGDAMKSKFIRYIDVNSKKFMPPKKTGMSPVTEQEKALVIEWMQNGAL